MMAWEYCSIWRDAFADGCDETNRTAARSKAFSDAAALLGSRILAGNNLADCNTVSTADSSWP